MFKVSYLLDQKVLGLERHVAVLEHEDDPVVLQEEPLGLDVAVPQPGLPDGGDLLGLLPAGAVPDLDEDHQRLALLGGPHHALRVAHVQLREVDLRLGLPKKKYFKFSLEFPVPSFTVQPHFQM